MKRKSVLLLVVLSLCLSLITVGCAQDSDPGGKGVIKISNTPYSSDWPSIYITKYVTEDLGYQAELVEGDIGFMYIGLAEGDIDIYPSCWIVNLHKTYKDKYGDKIEYAGINYENAVSGVGVPAYVDIDSLEDLKGNGAMFGNKIIGIEPSAGLMLTTQKAMEEYGLDDEYELVQGSTAGMLAELKRATMSEEPILFLPWRPHTLFQEFDVKILEDPKGVLVPDDVYIGVKPDLKDRAPDLYKFAQNFKIEISEIERIMHEGNNNEKEIAALSRQWVDDNQDKIDQWLGQ
ncbi:MAG: glycine betaine ABC transporter substrate-binding protein [Desulfotomaculaceae bacterium]|nr:glycine betaine ABC transporter substrate-binding protein [Desulfotomaculaceae bacterium]